MSIEIGSFCIFSKNFDEVDFAKTAKEALKFALPAIAMAGAVAMIEPMWGVVVILTGLVITAAYVIFCATLLAEQGSLFDDKVNESGTDYSSDSDSSCTSSDEELDLKPLPLEAFHLDLSEIETVIGPIQNLPVLDAPRRYGSKSLNFLGPKDLSEPLMQGTFEGKQFIAVKMHVSVYWYELDFDKINVDDEHFSLDLEVFKWDPAAPLKDSDIVEVLHQVEPNSQNWVVSSQLYPQGLSSEWLKPNWSTTSYPTREVILHNLKTLIEDKKPIVVQSGRMLYFYHFSSDSSLRVV